MQLTALEQELKQLRLRYQNRPAPYYQVIQEHFSAQQMLKFVPAEHECVCNVCGKDLEKLVRDKVDEMQSDFPMATAEGVGAHNAASDSEEVKKLLGDIKDLQDKLKASKQANQALSLRLEKHNLTPLLTEEQIMQSKPFKQLISEATKMQEFISQTDSLKAQNKQLEQQVIQLKLEKEKALAAFQRDKHHFIQETATLKATKESLYTKFENLQRRVGTDDLITARENEHKQLKEQEAQLKPMIQQAQKSVATQIELTRKERQRCADLESRLADVTKKYDDSKKAYFKSKEERERLRQENERYKSEGVPEKEVSQNTDVKNRYEQIKIKYRVSLCALI